jgi:hypothetical protein
VKEHFPNAALGVYPIESDSKLAIIVVANKYSPNNFWYGNSLDDTTASTQQVCILTPLPQEWPMEITLHLRPKLRKPRGLDQGRCALLRRRQRATTYQQAHTRIHPLWHRRGHCQGNRIDREEVPGRSQQELREPERRRIQGPATTTAGDETKDRVGPRDRLPLGTGYWRWQLKAMI